MPSFVHFVAMGDTLELGGLTRESFVQTHFIVQFLTRYAAENTHVLYGVTSVAESVKYIIGHNFGTTTGYQIPGSELDFIRGVQAHLGWYDAQTTFVVCTIEAGQALVNHLRSLGNQQPLDWEEPIYAAWDAITVITAPNTAPIYTFARSHVQEFSI